jgi:hypothetical protein
MFWHWIARARKSSYCGNLKFRPRAIVVESHGIYGAPSKLVRELLEQLDYAVVDCGVAEPRDPQGCDANDLRVLLRR